MKIKFTETLNAVGATYEKGQSYDIADERKARKYVAARIAVAVADEPAQPEPQSARARALAE